MSEIWSWSCAKCGKDGPYSGSDYKYPRGWRFNLTHGLVCSSCAKKYKVNTSDIEREQDRCSVKAKKLEVDKNKKAKSWELL